jgi:hypothetical protein
MPMACRSSLLLGLYFSLKTTYFPVGRPHIEGLLQPYTRMLPVLGGYIYTRLVWVVEENSKSKNHWVWVFEKSESKQRLFRLFTKSQRAGGFFKQVENHGYTSEWGTWFFL